MTKPHEETWEDDATFLLVKKRGWSSDPVAEFGSHSTDRLKLAAQAPMMARLLLTLAGDRLPCETCGGRESDDRHEACIRTTLRTAGVLP